MRRHVAIPVRSAVTATLLITGAIYGVCGGCGTLAERHEAKAVSVEPALAGGSPVNESTAALPQAQTLQTTKPSTIRKQRDEELAAEQQAARLPAQKPPKKKAADTHHRTVIISIPDRRLALLVDGEVVSVYPVAVGAEESPSPGGEFTVINQVVNPTYYHEGKEVAPGKSNPLGTRWMGLSAKGYGIHGTNVQSSVGKAASHGCFRMKKKDVEELFARLQVGDSVSVLSERDEITAGLFSADVTTSAAATNVKTETQVASATAAETTAGAER